MICLLCGKNTAKATRCTANPKYPKIAHCRACTAIWHTPLPTDAELSLWYSKQSMSRRWKGNLQNATRVNYEQNKDNFALNFAMLKNDLVRYPAGRVLDIGCYTGAFLNLFRSAGLICTGIDLNDGLLELGRSMFSGLDLRRGTINDFVFEQKFDIITFHQLLEHTNNPITFMVAVKKNLSEDGIIQFSVPDADINKKITYPEHLWHFTERSLTKLLEISRFTGIVYKRVSKAALICVARKA